MDEEYDAVVLGTGMVECVLSGLLSVSGKKVLHIDRNDYYGGEVASLNLQQLCQKFDKKISERFGDNREWNIDLCLKYVMAHGDLVGMFVFTGVTEYMDFKLIEGSFIQRKGKLHKVPGTEAEVVKSSLLGIFEKKRLRNLVSDANKCDLEKGELPKHFNEKTTMREVFDKYGVDENTRELVGHVIALHQTDDYLSRPCLETYRRMDIYSSSLNKYGKSPYLYPLYGLGEIPQAFARLSAVYGGTYMLRTPVDDIVCDEKGLFVGVKSGDNVVKAGMVIGDPSYFPGRSKKVGQIVRCISILTHPLRDVGDIGSCQVIIPSRETGRKSDIYVAIVSKTNETCPKGFYIAIVTAKVESSNPQHDIRPGMMLLGAVEESFTQVSDVYEPIDDGRSNKIFISKSYDATTHFDTATDDINDLWFRMTGEKLDAEKFKARVQNVQQ